LFLFVFLGLIIIVVVNSSSCLEYIVPTARNNDFAGMTQHWTLYHTGRKY